MPRGRRTGEGYLLIPRGRQVWLRRFPRPHASSPTPESQLRPEPRCGNARASMPMPLGLRSPWVRDT